jgi:hypothetical protein
VREAVVLRLPFPKRSYTFLRWREGSQQDAPAALVAVENSPTSALAK